MPETPTDTTIETASGLYFDFVNPTIESIKLVDIAHALSNICRFTGHCKEFYSVAQHSVLLSYRVPEPHQMAGLLHDASEAYLSDIARPLKVLPMFQGYKALEKRVERLIAQKYGFSLPLHESIKFADERMLCTEKRDLMGPSDWNFNVAPYHEKIEPLLPRQAEKQFIERYMELKLIHIERNIHLE